MVAWFSDIIIIIIIIINQSNVTATLAYVDLIWRF